ncbi:sugar ABC transporter substrate-binding protein [Streptomyces sp. NPDC001922]|uniref:sugar ABC transporter substrate-binding protein n=1 Tax=Streptomyces sp. NPDC001922 TaxID=3364624 RepID=UPI0036C63E5F
MRLRALPVAVAAAGLLLSSCGGTGSTGGATAAPLVGIDYPRSDTDFWNSFNRHTSRSAEKLGLELRTTTSQDGVASLTANVQTMISQGVKGVVMAPQDTAAIAPGLNRLTAGKVPVVTVDTRPDSGKVFMVVRADNRAYGTKACRYLGTKLRGRGKVVMLEGDLSSINGRDRTEAFNDCMAEHYPRIRVIGEATHWDPSVAAQKLQTDLTAHPDIGGVYMQSSFALSGTLQVLRRKGLLHPPADPRHVFVVSNDGIGEELKDIAAGRIDATVSQPADQYARYALFYIKAAIAGRTFRPGATRHRSRIVQVRPGVLEDQLEAPLVTRDGGTHDGVTSVKSTDPGLWGNHSR